MKRSVILNIIFGPSVLYNKILFRLRKVRYGRNVKLFGRISYLRSGRLILGDNVMIQSCRYANPLGDRTVFEICNGAVMEVGNNVGISASTFKAVERITIEDDVNIGAGCLFMDTDSHPLKYEDRINGCGNAVRTAPITVKKGAFIGARSIVLKGAVIGEGSVIGAGSVVAGSVPDGEIWAGNPAVFIRKI